MSEQQQAVTVGTIRKNSAEEVRILLDEFKGARLVSVRVFANYGSGDEPLPTKKGVSLRVDLLDDLIRELCQARAHAVDVGWLESEGA